MSVSITTAKFTDGNMWLNLSDGRILGVPLGYFPLLQNASPDALTRFELSPRGIHWDELDEDLSLQGLLSSQPFTNIRLGSGKKTQ